MRKLTFSALALTVFLAFSVHATTAQQSLEKLQAYSAKDVEVSATKTEDAVSAKNQEMIKTIEDTVDLIVSGKEKSNPKLLKELVRVAVLTFENDPSESASEMLLPLYKKEKKAVDEAIKSLPKKDAKELRESLKNTAREETEGNG
ncbi:hypothetical protein [Bdellovibrio sp. HCB-162]|uniref:hypothetical protein n=1 Tax=Bdellovibrio sp. HCB-162 TaxID=3394234 RepID=UPI0039BCC253